MDADELRVAHANALLLKVNECIRDDRDLDCTASDEAILDALCLYVTGIQHGKLGMNGPSGSKALRVALQRMIYTLEALCGASGRDKGKYMKAAIYLKQD